MGALALVAEPPVVESEFPDGPEVLDEPASLAAVRRADREEGYSRRPREVEFHALRGLAPAR